jgi:imidazolonepropionase
LAEYVDVFCESTAFSSEDVDIIFTKAKKLKYKLRLHTEQFNNIGGLQTAIKHKALSVDHLEVVKDEDVKLLSKSETVAVLLPGVSFFLNYDYSPARKLIDSGAVVALSTDYNPGSSNILNLHLIMSIASLKMKMSIEEIINAVTINAAKAIDLNKNIGSIEIGKQADFAVFDAKEPAEIVYNIGNNLNVMTIKKGKIVYERNEGLL